jgi:hypothetical protein
VASKIGTSSTSLTGLGNASQPVFLENGEFKVCNVYPDTSKFLTRIPDDVVRDSDIADFVTSSTTSLTNYVLTSTYESKIEELEGIIETLQNEIETLKNNSSGGDSSTEES